MPLFKHKNKYSRLTTCLRNQANLSVNRNLYREWCVILTGSEEALIFSGTLLIIVLNINKLFCLTHPFRARNNRAKIGLQSLIFVVIIYFIRCPSRSIIIISLQLKLNVFLRHHIFDLCIESRGVMTIGVGRAVNFDLEHIFSYFLIFPKPLDNIFLQIS